MTFDFPAAYDELTPSDDDYLFYAADQVDWRLGYSDVLGPGLAEFAVMSGHVAQVFTDDKAWLQVLSDIHGELTTTRDILAFRDEQALRASLEHTGFEIADVFGDWDRTPPVDRAPELIVIAASLDTRYAPRPS